MEHWQNCNYFTGNITEKHIGLLEHPFQLKFAIFGHDTTNEFDTYDNFRCKQDLGEQINQKIIISSPSSGIECSTTIMSK